MLVVEQPFEHRPQGGAADPLEDRVFALEDVVVGGLPDRDCEPAAAELVEVPPRLTSPGPRQAVEPSAPTRARAQLAEYIRDG